MMYDTNNHNTHQQPLCSGCKRCRSSMTNTYKKQRRKSSNSMITSLLWVAAVLATTPPTEAFVLANRHDRHHMSEYLTNQYSTTVQPSSSFHPTHTQLFSTMAQAIRPEDLLDSLKKNAADEEQLYYDFGFSTLPQTTTSSPETTTAAAAAALKIPDEEDVLEWAGRYTSVEALRQHFGSNQNKLWGDLQASTARRLYKTLLPRALLELSKLGQLQPQDLAPLAYQARVAAKLYARERCTVPARIAATLFDGFRQWMKYGKFQAHGMTYDQLWEKYAEKILQETENEHSVATPPANLHARAIEHDEEDDDDEECSVMSMSDDEDSVSSSSSHLNDEIAEQVCRKILERACVSNENVDSFALKGQHWTDEASLEPQQRHLLEQIRTQLEDDMYQLLLLPSDDDTTKTTSDNNQRSEENTKRIGLPTLRKSTQDKMNKGRFRLVQHLANRQRRLWNLKRHRHENKKNTKKTGKEAVEEALQQHYSKRNLPLYPMANDDDGDDSTVTTVLESDSDDDELRP